MKLATVCVLLVVGQTYPSGYLKFFDLDIGQSGKFPPQTNTVNTAPRDGMIWPFVVQTIIDKETMVVANCKRKDKPFVVSGINTEKLFDDKVVALTQDFRVTKTMLHGATTYVVVEVKKP